MTKYIVNNLSGQTINDQQLQPYKVYTALLTQSGGDDNVAVDEGLLIIGVTYYINNDSPGMDFTNVGAPNNIADNETYFVATGTTPNSWGTNEGDGNNTLIYNLGTPVATVLENTLGNIWFSYSSAGSYFCNSNGLFSLNKTTGNSEIFYDGNNDAMCGMYTNSFAVDNIIICSTTLAGPGNSIDNILNRVLIEIRVYN